MENTKRTDKRKPKGFYQDLSSYDTCFVVWINVLLNMYLWIFSRTMLTSSYTFVLGNIYKRTKLRHHSVTLYSYTCVFYIKFIFGHITTSPCQSDYLPSLITIQSGGRNSYIWTLNKLLRNRIKSLLNQKNIHSSRWTMGNFFGRYTFTTRQYIRK